MPSIEVQSLVALAVATVFVVVAFGLPAAYVLRIALAGKATLKAAQGWREAPGRILSSRIVTLIVQERGGDTRHGYTLEAEYEYTVEGIRYTSNRYALGQVPKGIPWRRIQPMQERYRAGADVVVYYDSANPQEACLLREAPYGNLTLAIGLFFLFIAVGGGCILSALFVRVLRQALGSPR